MKKSTKITLISILILIILFILNTIYYIATHFNERSETSLINQYYKLRDKDPVAAKHDLEILLLKNPKNLVALRELGYWYIRSGDTNSALKQFALVHSYYPNDPIISLELAKLLILIKQYDQARSLLKSIHATNDLQLQQHVQLAMATLPPDMPVNLKTMIFPPAKPQPASNVNKEQSTGLNQPIKLSEHDTLFNQYYTLKKTNPLQAWAVLQKIIAKYSTDVSALKEAGYTTLNAHDNNQAFYYFNRVYDITHDPQIAMQLGYILINLDRKRLAYYYFNLATHTTNGQNLIAAEMAKTNLSAAQMKLLPEPYYADIFYDPFYYSRFKMVVQPIIIKAGKVLNDKYQLKAYLTYQRTTDDKSTYTQQLPQIFQDNAAITAIGAQINPIPQVPLTGFIQAGKAVDIVYQNRSRWRSDLRGGFSYYKDWGEKPTYALQSTFSHNIIGDFYSDMIYFSRYRDIIGSVRLREGIRIFKYETSAIDLYLKGFVVWDTAHQFYNNIVEVGPGIAITPSNRYNVVLHLEALQGHYIPVTSPTPNPYNSNYHNNLLLLDCYFRV